MCLVGTEVLQAAYASVLEQQPVLEQVSPVSFSRVAVRLDH
jgi:hypothetical protein